MFAKLPRGGAGPFFSSKSIMSVLFKSSVIILWHQIMNTTNKRSKRIVLPISVYCLRSYMPICCCMQILSSQGQCTSSIMV